MQPNSFHTALKQKMDEYAHLVYKLTRKFSKDELYGATSQLRRSTISVVLNYIEGFARIKDKVHRNFIEISYGSLQESKYLLEFTYKENYMNKIEYDRVSKLADDIGAMLCGMLKKFKIEIQDS